MDALHEFGKLPTKMTGAHLALLWLDSYAMNLTRWMPSEFTVAKMPLFSTLMTRPRIERVSFMTFANYPMKM
jgi:hypothetical protein